MLHSVPRRAVRLPATVLASVLALSACSSEPDDAEPDPAATPVSADEAAGSEGPDDDAEPGDPSDTADVGSAVETDSTGGFLTLEEMPTCEEIHALLGAPVADLVPDPDAEPDETFEDALRYGISCSWFSPELFDPGTDVFERVEATAGISLLVTISGQPEDKETLSGMDWVAEDPRLDDVGGFIVTLGQDYDPAEPLGAVSPQVAIGRASFTFASMGVMLTDAESLSHLTNDWAVEASLTMYEALAQVP